MTDDKPLRDGCEPLSHMERSTNSQEIHLLYISMIHLSSFIPVFIEDIVMSRIGAREARHSSKFVTSVILPRNK